MSESSMSRSEPINVLLLGNNPTEIGDMYQDLQGFDKPHFVTQTAFNFRRIFRKIRKFKPASILIDDKLNRTQLNRLIKRIHRNPNTKDIPITVLKSSNEDLGLSAEIDNYILKENLSADNLYKTILNSHQLRKTSIYLYKRYKKSRNLLQKIRMDLKRMYWWTENVIN